MWQRQTNHFLINFAIKSRFLSRNLAFFEKFRHKKRLSPKNYKKIFCLYAKQLKPICRKSQTHLPPRRNGNRNPATPKLEPVPNRFMIFIIYSIILSHPVLFSTTYHHQKMMPKLLPIIKKT